MEKQRILLCEDDLSFGKILNDYLTLNGFEVTHTKDGIDGWNAYRYHHFDMCILDVMMPKRDGLELAGMIRRENRTVPLLFLTARNRKDDVLAGYNTGADDYLVKPVDADILLMKMRALLGRVNGTANVPVTSENFTIGTFTFNPVTRTLSRLGVEQPLSPREAELLQLLCLHLNTLVRREEILRQIWKEVNYFNGRSLDVYIVKLRKYLSADEGVALTNLQRSGYVLKAANG